MEPEKPGWFKIKYVNNEHTKHVANLMDKYNLHSVCQSAHCPNCSECWAMGTASFMVMGEICTRGCKFCAVKTMAKPPPLDPKEPEHLAKAISTLNLNYIVLTSVTRDDLEDGGAAHFAECVKQVKKKCPDLIVEILIPDFQLNKSSLKTVIDARPDVISHNVETVERLTPEVRDARANYRQSVEVLRIIKELSDGKIITKSGMMVGLGETKEEVEQTMKDLLDAGVEILTIGQYLRPSPLHLPIKDYITPEEFKEYEKKGYDLGFKYMACGPLVRSSYKAGEPFIKKILESRQSPLR